MNLEERHIRDLHGVASPFASRDRKHRHTAGDSITTPSYRASVSEKLGEESVGGQSNGAGNFNEVEHFEGKPLRRLRRWRHGRQR